MSDKIEQIPEDSAFEYAFEEVPKNKKKPLIGLTIVLAGFPIALSNFIIGGIVASGLTFPMAMLALLVGNLVLMSVVIFMGIIASREGRAVTYLSRMSFGKVGSYVFSLLLFFSALTWISVNADIFARLISTLFAWWPIPTPLTAALVVFMWLLSAMWGYKGLAIMSNIGVPAAVILAIFGIVYVGLSDGGYSGVFSYIPEHPITFTAATAAVIGGWIYGATITPDITRFAKNNKHVITASIIAFSIGCYGFQVSGAFVALSTGEGDFINAMVGLGLGMVAFLTAVFCLWTTEDKEIYTGSLALQNIIRDTKYRGKIKHIHTATFIATCAAIFAAGGIYSYIMPIIQALSILVPPIAGIMIAEGLFIKKSKHELQLNRSAFVTWFLGGLASYLALKFDFFIPPLIGLVFAGFTYAILEKISKKELSTTTATAPIIDPTAQKN